MDNAALKAIIRATNQALLNGVADGQFTAEDIAAEMSRQTAGWQAQIPAKPADDHKAAWARYLSNRFC